MRTSPRRSYRPNLDGFKLEDRIVLAAANAAAVSGMAAAAKGAPTPEVKAGFLQQTPIMLHSAFVNFFASINRANQSAVRALGNGQDPNALLASWKANTLVQGGILVGEVQLISNRIPKGQQNLFDPAWVVVPGSTPPTPGLKQQIDAMVATLNNNATTLESALGQNAPSIILQTYKSCKATMLQFVNNAIAAGVFAVGPNQGG